MYLGSDGNRNLKCFIYLNTYSLIYIECLPSIGHLKEERGRGAQIEIEEDSGGARESSMLKAKRGEVWVHTFLSAEENIQQ